MESRHYPNIKRKEKSLGMFYFWLGITKKLHRLGWFRLSKITARLIK